MTHYRVPYPTHTHHFPQLQKIPFSKFESFVGCYLSNTSEAKDAPPETQNVATLYTQPQYLPLMQLSIKNFSEYPYLNTVLAVGSCTNVDLRKISNFP